MSWGKRIGRIVLLLLLAELLFFFLLGTRIRRRLEGPRELLGATLPGRDSGGYESDRAKVRTDRRDPGRSGSDSPEGRNPRVA